MSSTKSEIVKIGAIATSCLAIGALAHKYVNSKIKPKSDASSPDFGSLDLEVDYPTETEPKHRAPWGKTQLGETRDLDIHIDEVKMLKIDHLSEIFGPGSNIPNFRRTVIDEKAQLYNNVIGDDDVILGDIVRNNVQHSVSRAFLRAGPRKALYCDPANVNACIVTCGGLCPGLNNVIHELVKQLRTCYRVKEVYGIRGGYPGFYAREPVSLTREYVAGCQNWGGTILGSGRGGFELGKTMEFIKTKNINQVYVIGGDGTHRGAEILAEECYKRKIKVAIAGIPKTIDNDIAFIDRSFGFDTAVEQAREAIRSAKVEARCAPGGIGVVKLMGRHAGFIAAHAALSSSDVDACLIPEVPLVLDGPRGILEHIALQVKRKGSAVVVVAEGAGEELLGKSATTDAGGNRHLPQIGKFVKSKIEAHFKERDMPCSVKYIDPSYMVRSVAANAQDSMLCVLLAQNAVHGAMAGYTGFCVGLVNNRMVYIPMRDIVKNSPRKLRSNGRTWERILSSTKQPNHAHSLRRRKSELRMCPHDQS
eukprot:TRINITY_DN779892_c0_g1_i1.p1 TRINITY_DN779892_c0_g1~~TRINITY_DN779892_c0_g1_i1.p1  ORF type:complete len:535 (+),score=158.47 TRINITY_DN779892_c0_g1_i1:35-1639(+)